MAGICLKQRKNLDLAGLILKVNGAAVAIEFGRKGFATKGKTEEGQK